MRQATTVSRLSALSAAVFLWLLLAAGASAQDTIEIGAPRAELDQAVNSGDAAGYTNANEAITFAGTDCRFQVNRCVNSMFPPRYFVSEVDVLLPQGQTEPSEVSICSYEDLGGGQFRLAKKTSLGSYQAGPGTGYELIDVPVDPAVEVDYGNFLGLCYASPQATVKTSDPSDSANFSESTAQGGTFGADNTVVFQLPGFVALVFTCTNDCPGSHSFVRFDLSTAVGVYNKFFDPDGPFVRISAQVKNVGETKSPPTSMAVHLKSYKLRTLAPTPDPRTSQLECDPDGTCAVPTLRSGERRVVEGRYGLSRLRKAGYGPGTHFTLVADTPCLGPEPSCSNNTDNVRGRFLQAGDSKIVRVGLHYRSARVNAKATGKRAASSSRLSGRAVAAGGPTDGRPKKLHVALVKLGKGQKGMKGTQPRPPAAKPPKCRWLKNAKGRFTKRKSVGAKCDNPKWLKAKPKGKRRKGKFVFKLWRGLKRGKYVLYSRLTSRSGGKEISFTKKDRNRIQFKLKRR